MPGDTDLALAMKRQMSAHIANGEEELHKLCVRIAELIPVGASYTGRIVIPEQPLRGIPEMTDVVEIHRPMLTVGHKITMERAK